MFLLAISLRKKISGLKKKLTGEFPNSIIYLKPNVSRNGNNSTLGKKYFNRNRLFADSPAVLEFIFTNNKSFFLKKTVIKKHTNLLCMKHIQPKR